MRRAARAVLGLVAVALALTPVWATTAVERTDTDLIQEATVIVTGHCTHLQSQWIDRTLVTIATISVSEVLKGQAGSVVTVVLPGGIDTNRRVPIAMSYPGAPEIRQQENVLLFLRPESQVPQGYAIVGFSQGKLTVAANGQGQPVASQNLSALNLQGRSGAVSPGRSRTMLLSELRQKIQQTLAGTGSSERR
ncbi:MAG: hypothetical protein WAM82_32605 [Thermoanaerobaculia bacterium]